MLLAMPAVAGSLPLTANEIGLMLRGGYSTSFVQQELAKRHFLGSLDLAQEEALVKAGASAELIAELNSGKYALSSVDAVKAEQHIVNQSNARTIAAERAHEAEKLYQAQLQKDRTNATREAQGASATVDFLSGSLVRYHNGSIVPVEDDALSQKKLILYYFSAHWCGPCRKFTPKLIDYYNRVVAAHPEVELVFYSFDHSANEMQQYMAETGMPWLAIDYAKRGEKQQLTKPAGDGIPALYLCDRTGKLLSNAVVDGKYVGPDHVLADLDAMLQAPHVAQAK